MKVLLVEDDFAHADRLVGELIAQCSDLDIDRAASRDAALSNLRNTEYDLVLCDLKIPPVDNSLDVDEEHGFAVFEAARASYAGVPLIFFTAHATVKNTSARLAGGPIARLYGNDEVPMVDLAVKDDRRACVEKVARIHKSLSKLSEQTLTIEDGSTPDELLARAIRIFGLVVEAVSAEVHPLGGLSGAPIGRVSYRDTNRQVCATAVLKLLDREGAINEEKTYASLVASRLQPGVFVPTIKTIMYGLRSRAAIAYTVAAGAATLFERIAAEPDAAVDAITNLRAEMQPWYVSGAVIQSNIGVLRRSRTPDEVVRAREPSFAPLEVENHDIRASTVIQHGDLHGENVLVLPNGAPVLIDFADVGPAVPSLDPITLEMSLVVHPRAPDGNGWPSIDQARQWADVDAYVDGCPFADVVRACREWALDAGCQVTYASAYLHAMRQLKYDDVPCELPLAIAASASDAFVNC